MCGNVHNDCIMYTIFGDLRLVEPWILHKRSVLFLEPILTLKILSLGVHLFKKKCFECNIYYRFSH